VKQILPKYVAFLRQPDVATLLLVGLVSRMPVGMVGFAMLMFLRESLGNFALAGIAAGVYLVSMAAAAPVQGRLIDRLGPRRPLLVTSVVQPLALAALFASVKLHWPFPAVAACASLAGLFASPITTLTRTIWRHMFEREEDRRTAFSLDAVTIELNFTLGPALVAILLATADATVAFAVSIGFVAVAAAVYLASPALRYFKRETGVDRHLLGPLTEPRLLLLFGAIFGLTVCFGFLEVGYPAYAMALGMPALGGVLLAVNSLGSALGGAIYGGLHFRSPVERQFAGALALMVVPLLLHVVAQTPFLFAVAAFLAGALIAPSLAAQSVLVSRFAPSKYATEAFTWSSTFIVSGIGLGIAVGGAIVEAHGVRAAFGCGAAIVAAVSLLALTLGAPRPGAVLGGAAKPED
jgi:MFS family permease